MRSLHAALSWSTNELSDIGILKPHHPQWEFSLQHWEYHSVVLVQHTKSQHCVNKYNVICYVVQSDYWVLVLFIMCHTIEQKRTHSWPHATLLAWKWVEAQNELKWTVVFPKPQAGSLKEERIKAVMRKIMEINILENNVSKMCYMNLLHLVLFSKICQVKVESAKNVISRSNRNLILLRKLQSVRLYKNYLMMF